MIPLAILQGQGAAPSDVLISAEETDLDLKAYYEALYGPAPNGSSITFTVTVDPISSNPGFPSIRTGVWDPSITLSMVYTSLDTKGAGGVGGPGGSRDGGTAFMAEHLIDVDATGATFSGGGGGGGDADGASGNFYPNAGGGGGAGTSPGGPGPSSDYDPISPVFAEPGTETTGGAGANVGKFIPGSEPSNNRSIGGDGGDLGQAGDPGQVSGPSGIDGPGGAAGFSVDGLSNVTWIGTPPTLVGPTNG